jgi:prolyl oligopeptidase
VAPWLRRFARNTASIRLIKEPIMSSYRTFAGSMLLGLAAVGIAHAQAPAPAAANTDPHLWLEEVLGDKPLAWVRQHNAVTVKELESQPGFALQARLKTILTPRSAFPT